MPRIIFIDDEARSRQIKDYLLELGRGGVAVGPTEHWQKEFQSTLEFGVFRDVDGAVEYINELVESNYEWNAIDGMIVDTLMPPGKFLETEYNAPQELAGPILVKHLSAKMVEYNRLGLKIYMLTNFRGTMKKLETAYRNMQIHFEKQNNNVILSESGIEIRYYSKEALPSKIPDFVRDLNKWIGNG
jgi:hypothetical protein